MIELINDLWVKAETLNYTLLLDTKTVNKEGEVIYKPLAYVSTLEQAVRTARDYSIKNKLSKGKRDLPQAVQEIKQIDKEFAQLLAKVLESTL